MSTFERSVFALFVVSSVSGAHLGVLVTGHASEVINADIDSVNSAGKKELIESLESIYTDPNPSDEGPMTQGEYEKLLGIDPLANSFAEGMDLNEGGKDKHFVKKRVLPVSEEKLIDDAPPASPEMLDLLQTKEKSDLDKARLVM